LHGTWLEYYQDNQPASITNYSQGKINSVIYYTKTGEKIEQEQHQQSPKLFFNRRCEIVEELINANFYGTPVKLSNGNTSCVLYDMEGNKIVSVQWSDPALSKKTGRFEQYDTTGILRFACTYDNNQLTGTLKSWYETGILADSGNMKKNMRDGIWESWYESGQKKDSGAFVNNVPKDLWVHWEENGQTKTLGSYGKYGKTGDWKTYDKNGKILYIQHYRKSRYNEAEMIRINE
jgi:antitoxin component YwqK of YwqJK toxin-antitoxin module